MDVVKRIAPRRRVVAPDLPGHGQSDRWHPPPEVSIPMYRDAVGTVCANLEIDKVVLVGHSMGGLIALATAAAWPERVAGVVLVASGARLAVSPNVYRRIREDYAKYPEWLAKVAWSPATPREIVERWNGVTVTAEQEITDADFQAIDRFDARDLLGRIKAPTLVVGGADDLLTPPKLSHELGQIAGARVAILPEAGHMLLLERPDAFHAELDLFLASVN
jgi:pimeloyl-ACP methyl ester carboxylesterase